MSEKWKRIRPILIIVVVLGTIVLCILRANGVEIALQKMGKKEQLVALYDVDEQGNEYRVLLAYNNTALKQDAALVRLRKTKGFGMWVPMERADFLNSPTERAAIHWCEKEQGFNGETVAQWHYVYYYKADGSKTPYIEKEQLPHGVAIETLHRGGTKNFVHLITYLPPEEMTAVDVFALLEENGCIS